MTARLDALALRILPESWLLAVVTVIRSEASASRSREIRTSVRGDICEFRRVEWDVAIRNMIHVTDGIVNGQLEVKDAYNGALTMSHSRTRLKKRASNKRQSDLSYI